MSVPCSDQDLRPKKAKNASLPRGVRAERCWCGHLAKVKVVEDFSDQLGMKFFMCANYDASPPRRASSSSTRPPVCCESMLNRQTFLSLFFLLSYFCCSLLLPSASGTIGLTRSSRLGRCRRLRIGVGVHGISFSRRSVPKRPLHGRKRSVRKHS